MNEDMIRQVVGRLHSSATRLLRDTRGGSGDGISGARLSALGSIAAAGPMSLAALAARERVRAPTMSRVVDALVRDGLVTREIPENDRRRVRIAATPAGITFLDSARRAQAGALSARLARLADSEKRALLRGVEILERLTA